MIISSYISELIKESDCVIIPGVGGFVASYRPASSDVDRNWFYPPSKEIAFNRQLQSNDGLLANFIAKKMEVTFIEANEMIREQADQIVDLMEEGEYFELEGIGVLHLDRNENIIFEPRTTENLLSDAFGLDSFHFQMLDRNSKNVEVMNRNQRTTLQFSIPSNRIKQVLVGLPVIAILSLIPMSQDAQLISGKVSTSVNQQAKTMEFATPISYSSLVPEPSPLSLMDIDPVDVMEEELNSRTSKEEVIPVEEISIDIFRPYTIVGGCFGSEENAQRLSNRIIDQGYEGEVTKMDNGMFRVLYGRFEKKQEALSLISVLNKEPNNLSTWLSIDKQ